MALSARARIAGLSGLLTVAAVFLAVTPFFAQEAFEALQDPSEPGLLPTGRARQVLPLALVLGCLAGGLIAGTVRQLLQPLEGMAEAARALAAGQEVEVAVPGEPELQPVAQALQQLAVAQRAREDEIELRLALTQELAAVVAHEVRNPLQSLTMLADLVAHEPEEARRREVLEGIQQELALIEEVVRRLVDSGGELQLLRRAVDLGELLERCRRLQAPLAREGSVELSIAGSGAEVRADGPLLRRAVENLVHNAVCVLAEQGGGRVVLATEVSPSVVRVIVEDDGPGVAESERERIFEAGVSGRSGGSGLGLALARRVAEAHGGSLGCSRSALGGARFTLELPVESV